MFLQPQGTGLPTLTTLRFLHRLSTATGAADKKKKKKKTSSKINSSSKACFKEKPPPQPHKKQQASKTPPNHRIIPWGKRKERFAGEQEEPQKVPSHRTTKIDPVTGKALEGRRDCLALRRQPQEEAQAQTPRGEPSCGPTVEPDLDEPPRLGLAAAPAASQRLSEGSGSAARRGTYRAPAPGCSGHWRAAARDNRPPSPPPPPPAAILNGCGPRPPRRDYTSRQTLRPPGAAEGVWPLAAARQAGGR